MGRLRRSQRGGILIEGVVALTVLLLAICLNLEMVRRSQFEVLLHHGAFLFVRGRALGVGLQESRQVLTDLLTRGLGKTLGSHLSRSIHLQETSGPGGRETTLHIRFPTFMRFEFPDGRGRTKHHFELTKRCRF